MEKNINKRFGERVKEIRKSKGFSQKELSEKSGINRSYISGIERGEKNSTLSNVSKIATGLDVPIAILFVNTLEIKEELEEEIDSEDFESIFRSFAATTLGLGGMLGPSANDIILKKIRKHLEPLIEEKIEKTLKQFKK